MPNGRFDYDLDGAAPGPLDDRDLAPAGPAGAPLDARRPGPYRDLAPDCMGRWVVYWRQNMPGLDNTALDDDGRPMKNWWPFLFY